LTDDLLIRIAASVTAVAVTGAASVGAHRRTRFLISVWEVQSRWVKAVFFVITYLPVIPLFYVALHIIWRHR
jgi:hypothetical protein